MIISRLLVHLGAMLTSERGESLVLLWEENFVCHEEYSKKRSGTPSMFKDKGISPEKENGISSLPDGRAI